MNINFIGSFREGGYLRWQSVAWNCLTANGERFASGHLSNGDRRNAIDINFTTKDLLIYEEDFMRFLYFASLITWPIKCARNISSADEPWRAEVKRFSDSFKILNCGQLLKSYSILNRRCFLGRKRALCRRWCVAIALKAFTTLSSFWPFPKLNLSQYLHVSINVSSSSIIQQQQQKSLSITCFDWKAICIKLQREHVGA